ncbi:MAG: hypothetical protein IJB86_03320 [Clostridia bacterium]|nr:hypothetical protein [Clostridia bacterium]
MANDKNRVVLTPSRIFIYGVVVKNPILVQVIGLCPAVAACADIYVASLLSAVILFLLILCELAASALLKNVSAWVRMALYFVMGLIVSSLATMFAEMYVPQIANTAGVYLPLMAASSAAALRCENFAVKKSIRLSFYDAAANGIGTSLVLLFTGFVRGLLGVGTIGEFVVFEKAPISGLSMPFGGFIMLGFSAALLKWFISTFLSDYSHDMSFGIKRAKKKRPPARKTPAPIKKSKPVKKNDVASQPVEVNEPVTEQEEPVTEEPVTETVDQTLITDEFDLFNFSVDDEIDAIMSGLSSFDSILDEISKEKEDSENE